MDQNTQTTPVVQPQPETLVIETKKPCCKPVIWVGIGVILTALIGGGVLFALNLNKVKPVSVQPSPAAVVSSPEEKIVDAIGYKNKFIFNLPSECNEQAEISRDQTEKSYIITCKTNNFQIIINPSHIGSGRPESWIQLKNGIKNIAGFDWNYNIWTISGSNKAESVYIHDISNSPGYNHIEIGVSYNPYSQEAENYFDQILSTFKFTDEKLTTNSPQPSSLQGWKTHSNPEYGFEFQYPATWEGFGDGTSNGYFRTPSKNTINLGITYSPVDTIAEFLQQKDNLSKTANEGKPVYTVTSTKKTVINGLNCIQRTEYLSAADFTITATYFMKNNNFVSLAFYPTPGNATETDKKDYDQLLSTFKFTE